MADTISFKQNKNGETKMRQVVRKPTLRICENKEADQLRGNREVSFAVTAKLISVFVFATRIVQFLYFPSQNFPVSSHHSSVCVEPFLKPHCLFSHEAAHMVFKLPLDASCYAKNRWVGRKGGVKESSNSLVWFLDNMKLGK